MTTSIKIANVVFLIRHTIKVLVQTYVSFYFIYMARFVCFCLCMCIEDSKKHINDLWLWPLKRGKHKKLITLHMCVINNKKCF